MYTCALYTNGCIEYYCCCVQSPKVYAHMLRFSPVTRCRRDTQAVIVQHGQIWYYNIRHHVRRPSTCLHMRRILFVMPYCMHGVMDGRLIAKHTHAHRIRLAQKINNYITCAWRYSERIKSVLAKLAQRSTGQPVIQPVSRSASQLAINIAVEWCPLDRQRGKLSAHRADFTEFCANVCASVFDWYYGVKVFEIYSKLICFNITYGNNIYRQKSIFILNYV